MKTIILIITGLLVIGVGWYVLSPLLMNKHIEDALPVAETPQSAMDISMPIPVADTAAHPASGVVRVVKNGDETIIRYENYKTINGPDVRVYLANDLKATEYVDLGPIKGTEGNINYPVPKGVDISKYRYVLTWCEDFSVLFNSADLSLAR